MNWDLVIMFGFATKEDVEAAKAAGQHICPQCKNRYTPTPYEETKPGTIEREQWITGVCSDDCWDTFAG